MIDYDIRPYEARDLESVVDLYEQLSRGDRDLRRRYFEWKYLANPFIQPPIMMLAHLGGNVAGMRGIYGSSWRDARTGSPIVIPHADDLSIHPEHRNRGLFLPLMEALSDAAALRGHPWIIGLSGGLTTQKLALATGWTSLGEIDRHVRPSRFDKASRWLGRLRPMQRAAGLRKRLLGRGPRSTPPLLPAEADVDRVVERIASPAGPVSRRDSAFLGEIATIAGAADRGDEALLRAARDERYLGWRLSNPGRTYRILSWDDGGSRGYAILAWSQRAATRVSVADFAFTDRDAFEGLVRALCRVERLEIMMMTARLPPDRIDLLRALGFAPLLTTVSASRARAFLLLPTHPGTTAPSPDLGSSTLADWDFNLLETMQV